MFWLKNNLAQICIRGDNYQKKSKKSFFVDALQFIHHLKALVELTRFLSVLKSLRVFLSINNRKIETKSEFLTFFTKPSKSGKVF
jgi:hypothetical protein